MQRRLAGAGEHAVRGRPGVEEGLAQPRVAAVCRGMERRACSNNGGERVGQLVTERVQRW